MKITKTTTEEREVSLPYFCKDLTTYYAVLSEKEMLTVTYREFVTQTPCVFINSVSPSLPDNATEIKASEFCEAFQKANDYLADTFEGLRDVLREKHLSRFTIGEGEE